jgi:hypothetical protein
VKREDVEAFKNAENQEVPAAERLEEISKAEMSYWIDEVDIRTQQLEEARLEYQVLPSPPPPLLWCPSPSCLPPLLPSRNFD